MTKFDIKYIIKKILIYSGVALILMFVKSCDIKAATWSNAYNNYNNPNQGYVITSGSWNYQIPTNLRNYWANKKGQLIFTIYQAPVTTGAELVREVIVKTGGNTFACNMGNVTFYNDNSTMRAISTVTCQVEFDTSGWTGIEFQMPSSQNNNTYVLLSSQASLTETIEDGQSAITTQLNDIYNRMSGGFSDIYNMTNQQFNIVNQHLIDIYNQMTTQNQSITTAINNQSQQQHQDMQDIKDTINNDNVDNQQSSDFFNNFGSTTNQGLQDLIKKPIDIVDSFYNSCSPITFDIPYFDTTITLPCISSIQNDFTGVIFPIIRVIINGLLCYRILTRFIDEINKLKDPNNSDLEVVDL